MNTKTEHGSLGGTDDFRVSAVIVAAGSGTRMGGISKPEIRLDGITLFERVLHAFTASLVQEIVVVCGENRARLEALAAACPCDKPVRFCTGGKTRAESVFLGVSAADVNSSLLCVHDCARPFVTPELIDQIIRAAAENGAASACAPVTDTIKYVDSEHHILYTPKRQYLLAMQTPQAFPRKTYLAAYAHGLQTQATFTDESALLEAAGHSVAHVPASSRNIKLTTREDLLLARAILAMQKADERNREFTSST